MSEISPNEPQERQLDNELEEFVGIAINLMKEERFQEATRHLRNQKVAARMGFGYEAGRTMFLDRVPPLEEIESIIDFVGYESIFWLNPPKVQFASVVGMVVENGAIKEIKLPQIIHRNVALIHAEEWLHGLQYLRGGSIAGIPDHEIDVAAYIHGRGIPLTHGFLKGHGRNAHQFLKENPSPV